MAATLREIDKTSDVSEVSPGAVFVRVWWVYQGDGRRVQVYGSCCVTRGDGQAVSEAEAEGSAMNGRPMIGQRVRRQHGPGADGQLGRIVAMDGGELGVRKDTTAQELVVPWSSDWVVERAMKLGPMQLARICYEADHALRIARGHYDRADWQSCKEQDRIAWSRSGPPKSTSLDDDEERKRLFNAIVGVFEDR